MENVKALRASFEDTMANQEKLRQQLDQLVEENRPLKPEERGPFFERLGRALLGQGAKIPVEKGMHGEPVQQLWGGERGELNAEVGFTDSESFLRFLGYWASDTWGDKPIAYAWQSARQLAFRIFPLAIAEALRASIERVPYTSAEAQPT
jgi:hypothetical protein